MDASIANVPLPIPPAPLCIASLEDLPAFKFGNAQNRAAGTGCTVVVAPEGAVAGVDVRGGGPATRETDLLAPENSVQEIYAVTLSGGSAYGLAASTGVMEALGRRGIGFELLGLHVPIVCGACLFDLPVGESSVWPDARMGATAVGEAFAGAEFKEGNVGAGTGATVGKLNGIEGAMKSGLAHVVYRLDDLVVGAVVAVNAIGCVVDRSGATIAGYIAPGTDAPAEGVGAFLDIARASGAIGSVNGPVTNTTLCCVVTNARLTKAQAKKVASIAHDGYARAIYPVHTSNDGDTIFCMASGEVEATPDVVAVMAVEAVQDAIIRAAQVAASAYGLPGLAG